VNGGVLVFGLVVCVLASGMTLILWLGPFPWSRSGTGWWLSLVAHARVRPRPCDLSLPGPLYSRTLVQCNRFFCSAQNAHTQPSPAFARHRADQSARLIILPASVGYRTVPSRRLKHNVSHCRHVPNTQYGHAMTKPGRAPVPQAPIKVS